MLWPTPAFGKLRDRYSMDEWPEPVYFAHKYNNLRMSQRQLYISFTPVN